VSPSILSPKPRQGAAAGPVSGDERLSARLWRGPGWRGLSGAIRQRYEKSRRGNSEESKKKRGGQNDENRRPLFKGFSIALAAKEHGGGTRIPPLPYYSRRRQGPRKRKETIPGGPTALSQSLASRFSTPLFFTQLIVQAPQPLCPSFHWAFLVKKKKKKYKKRSKGAGLSIWHTAARGDPFIIKGGLQGVDQATGRKSCNPRFQLAGRLT